MHCVTITAPALPRKPYRYTTYRNIMGCTKKQLIMAAYKQGMTKFWHARYRCVDRKNKAAGTLHRYTQIHALAAWPASSFELDNPSSPSTSPSPESISCCCPNRATNNVSPLDKIIQMGSMSAAMQNTHPRMAIRPTSLYCFDPNALGCSVSLADSVPIMMDVHQVREISR